MTICRHKKQRTIYHVTIAVFETLIHICFQYKNSTKHRISIDTSEILHREFSVFLKSRDDFEPGSGHWCITTLRDITPTLLESSKSSCCQKLLWDFNKFIIILFHYYWLMNVLEHNTAH